MTAKWPRAELDPVAEADLAVHVATQPAHGGDLAGTPRPPTSHTHIISEVVPLQTELDAKQARDEKDQPNGYAGLDSAGKVTLAEMPDQFSAVSFKGMWDASTNTPIISDGVGTPGDTYRVSVAGTQDLGSGSIDFLLGDFVILNSSLVWERSGTTDAVSSVAGKTGDVVLNTSDIAGLTSALSGKQANDPELTALAGLVGAPDVTPYFTGPGAAALTPLTGFARSLLDDSDAPAARATLGTDAIGDPRPPSAHTHPISDITALQTALNGKQAVDDELTALASVVSAADKLPYFTGLGTADVATLTPFARTFLDDTNDSAVRATIGAQRQGAPLDALRVVSVQGDRLPYFNGPTTAATTVLTAFSRTLLDDVDSPAWRTTLGIIGAPKVITIGGQQLLKTDPEIIHLAPNIMVTFPADAAQGQKFTFVDYQGAWDTTPVTTIRAAVGLQTVEGQPSFIPSAKNQRTTFALAGTNWEKISDTTPYVEPSYPFIIRTTADMISGDHGAELFPKGSLGLRMFEDGSFGASAFMSPGWLEGGSTRGPLGFGYRAKGNSTALGAIARVRDYEDNPQYQIERVNGPQTLVGTGAPTNPASGLITIGWNPVTVPTISVGTDPHSIIKASTVAALNSAGASTFNVTGGTIGFASDDVFFVEGPDVWVEYHGKTGSAFLNCIGAPATAGGEVVVSDAWGLEGADQGTAWPDVDHGGEPATINCISSQLGGVVVDGKKNGQSLGRILAPRLQFSPPAFLDVVAHSALVKVGSPVTLDQTPRDILFDYPGLRRPPKTGTLLREGSNVVISYANVQQGNGIGNEKIVGATIASGTLPLVPGDRVFQRLVIANGDNLAQMVKPEPVQGGDGSNVLAGQSLGRFVYVGSYIPDDGESGNDKYTDTSKSNTVMAATAAEDFLTTQQGSDWSVATTAIGTRGPKERLFVHPIGTVEFRSGMSLGGRKDAIFTSADTISLFGVGQYSRMDVNQFELLTANLVGTATITTVTPGDANNDEIQRVTVTASDGTLNYRWTAPNGTTKTSDDVPYDATQGELLNLLQDTMGEQGFELFQPGDIKVVKAGNQYTITFGGSPVETRLWMSLVQSAATTIRKITGAEDGQVVEFHALNNNHTFEHNATGTDTFELIGLAPLNLKTGEWISFVYDIQSHRWRQRQSPIYDPELRALAGLVSAANQLPYFTGSGTASLTTLSAFIRTLLDDGDAATARATLGAGTSSFDGAFASLTGKPTTLAGYGITDAQGLDAELTALANLVSAANKLPYFTGSGTASLADLTAFARTILDDADAATVRATIGAGTSSFDGAFASLTGKPTTLAGYGITDAQAHDTELDALAALVSSADKLPYFTGSGAASLADFTTQARQLLDDGSFSAMRTTLGLVIGTDVEAHDATLTALAGLATGADKLAYSSGTDVFSQTDFTTQARQLLDDTSFSAMRTTLGLAIGTDVQAFDSELAALAGLVSAADKLPYFTGSGTAGLADFTAAGRALVDDADATAQRVTLGLVIGTNVEAHDADLTTIAGLSPSADDILQFKSSAWANRTMAQLAADLTTLAPKAGPTFTGTVVAPTPTDDSNTTTVATTAFVKSTRRDRALNAARNLITESWPLALMTAGQVLPTQQATFIAVGLVKGEVITNIVVGISQGGSGAAPTKVEFGLYDKSGNLLGTTGDIKGSASIALTGLQQFALTTPYTVASTDLYYVALLQNGVFGTPLNLLRVANVAATGVAISGGSRDLAIQTGQTALPNPATLANSGASTAFWVGVN